MAIFFKCQTMLVSPILHSEPNVEAYQWPLNHQIPAVSLIDYHADVYSMEFDLMNLCM